MPTHLDRYGILLLSRPAEYLPVYKGPAVEPAPQHSFGKYLILERIASGGMAEIYKARLDGIGGFHRFFAIKRVRPDLSQDKEYVDLLVEEAKIAGLLSHANIVQILDLGKIDDLYYVAMEYVDGRDLGSILERCKQKGITIPVPHAVFIAIEMLKGLEYAHQRQILRGGRPVPLNIIHRDISPSNMLLSFQGEVKLTDFGMARAKVRAAKTLSGTNRGRFDYCSPEQATGDALDQRSDLFSSCVVLYEMLCGVHPFKKQGDIQTIDAIRSAEYQVPSYVNPDVPYALEQVLARALSKDPSKRFATAADLKSELNSFFHESGFIFSHSTLAAFLKGLFPELTSRRKSRKDSMAEQETVTFNAAHFPNGTDSQLSNGPEDTEAPTSLSSDVGLAIGAELPDLSGSTGAEEMETLLRRMPDSTGTGSFGPTPGPTDDATLIRRRPPRTDEDDWTDDQRTQVHPDARQEEAKPPTSPYQAPVSKAVEDQEPKNLENLLESTPFEPEPLDLGEPLQTQETKTTAPELKPAKPEDFPNLSPPPVDLGIHSTEDRPIRSARKSSPTKASSRIQIMMALIGTICLILGVAAGFFMGIQASNPPEVTQNAVSRKPPVLRISGPEGTKLTVGDRDFTLNAEEVTTITLSEDEPTTMRAELEGYAPIERLYKLEANAEHDVVLEWAKLRKRE
ncbi:MAG: protein kinase [Myxococcota bacterium]|nr:protein kinase [Myxococcota bacterium]